MNALPVVGYLTFSMTSLHILQAAVFPELYSELLLVNLLLLRILCIHNVKSLAENPKPITWRSKRTKFKKTQELQMDLYLQENKGANILQKYMGILI